jgi:hypothetical protein
VSRLFLQCGLCGRKQADGLLSRAYWGHLETGVATLCACPTCKQHADWEERLRQSAGVTAPTATGLGDSRVAAG